MKPCMQLIVVLERENCIKSLGYCEVLIYLEYGFH